MHFTYKHGCNLDSLEMSHGGMRRYDFVVNCCGIIRQKHSTGLSLYHLNSILPKRLGDLCDTHGARLIHVSTDCIFSGNKGSSYHKTDPCDAQDDYGISKYLGEDPIKQILFRTSIFGPASDSFGLFEWFRSSKEPVNGFTNHIWSGVTTLELSKQISIAIRMEYKPSLYQISTSPVTKYELLSMTNHIFGFNKTIIPTTEASPVIVDRSLVSDYTVKDIDEQLMELRDFCASRRIL
jgi:dTDP-4-dehydrorhamnose reductase